MTAAQLVPQSDCAELQQVDVSSEVLDCPKISAVLSTYARKRNKIRALGGGDMEQLAIRSPAH